MGITNCKTIIAAAVCILFVAGSGGARTPRGETLLAEGRKAEQRSEWDRALELYEQALSEDPSDAAYQIAARRARFQAAQSHIDLGRKLRRQGRPDLATPEFEKAAVIDPSSSATAEQARAGDTAVHSEAVERIGRMQPSPELRLISRQAINMRMTSQPPKVLYETVGKLAGLNVMFDAEYAQADAGAKRLLSVELNNSTLEDALDYLAALTRTFWKPLSSNAILVAADNQPKRRDLEAQVVKVFYLTNITAPQELTEIVTTLRTVAEFRKMFQVTSLNAIVVKGSADQVALAEKLVNDLDKPRAEVVVDVLVMEANRAKTRDLAASIAGISSPIVFTPRDPVTAATDTTTDTSTSQLMSLARIARLSTNDFSITLPGALLNFVMSDRNTRVMQSPQVRAASGQKASLRIGDKVPVASGGFQPLGGTSSGYNSLYSQFQFLDVGVNVDITPTVHGDGDVTLKVMFEISNVRDRISVGGVDQPVIGQRKVEHEIRIREGEASLLGGLIQDQDTKSVSGVPGLGRVPVLRRLFTSESTERSQGELLIVLIPHVVRTHGVTDLNLRAVAAGSDQAVKVNRAPRP